MNQELSNTSQSATNPEHNAIAPPGENVVNRLTEIFDLEDFNGFLALLEDVEEPTDLIETIEEPEDIALFSDSFDDPEFVNFFQDLVDFNFGNVAATETGTITDRAGKISGTKWHDFNGDGVRDENEPGLADRTIYLDDNENGQLDQGETSVVTDEEGNYQFEDLEVPRTYVVAEVPQEGEVITNDEDSIVIDRSKSPTSTINEVPNDPLFSEQWHLHNTGQTGGTPGADANVIPAWQKATGKDVTIGIVDSGVQFEHPDLAENYVSELSYDFIDNDSDPTPISPGDEELEPHGTAVAGVAAATTNNGTGVSGVAPNASVAGLRLLPDVDIDSIPPGSDEIFPDAQVAEALSFKNQEIDIYNNSWGDRPKRSLGTETLAALQDGVRNGRGGLGSIFVFAAGNFRPLQNDVNYSPLANSRHTIAVTAIDHRGEKSYYSDSGASLLVSGYSNNIDPGITTTDLQGSDGYNPEGDYNDGFGGTSSAAPLVSGVIALMLEANPNLTYRDVQHILVETSTQNDPTDSGWSINGAGHEINHKYGFGAIDADAAVDAAENWTTVEPEVVTTSDYISVDTAIPDNNGEDLTSTVNIAEDINIEWAEVVFDAEHTQRGDLEITLTSPDGTESILAETHRDPNNNYDRYVFTSTRHWDESSLGDWTLNVADNTTGETGTWNSWQLNLYGTDPDSTNSGKSQQVTLDYGETVDRVNFGSQVDSDELPIDETIDDELNGTGNLSDKQLVNNQTKELSQKQSQKLNSAIEQTDRDLGSSDIAASIGVVNPDGTWTGATGVSNLSTQQPTQTDDLFNIASITKSYTSAVILKLQEQGILSLNDTIDKWLPDIAANITNGESLTIREILNGTGGLYNYAGDEEYLSDFVADYLSGSNRDWQPEELVAYAFDKPSFSGADSTEQWTYTSTGNIIASLITEEATGKPFEQILDEEILEPLGLEKTFFSSEDVSLEQRARGYADIFTADGTSRSDGILEDFSSVNPEILYGASIISSAEDLAIFFNSLASGGLLSPESTAEIFNYVDTGFDSDSPEFPLEQFGLGVYPTQSPWGETRSAGGGFPGYEMWVNYFSDSDTTISVLINRSGSEREDLFYRAYQASIANTLELDNNSAIHGTEVNDHLAGTSNNDIINGLEGDDTLIGKEGLDALDGGVGNDRIEGDRGDDILFGKEGADSLYGGADNDFVNGGIDNDHLYGEAGDDSLVGSDGHDTLNGGADNDVLDGGTGNDELTDTEGNNTLYGNDGDDLLFAGMGNDFLYGDAGNDVLHSDGGNDQLFGGVGDDELDGRQGDDNLIGGEGDDTITGWSGNDTLAGDAGSDRFILSLDGTDFITDFIQGEDAIALPENISFGDLEIIQGQGDNANNTLVNFESETIAVLNDLNSTEISQSDFVV